MIWNCLRARATLTQSYLDLHNPISLESSSSAAKGALPQLKECKTAAGQAAVSIRLTQFVDEQAAENKFGVILSDRRK